MNKILCIGEALIDMICTNKGTSLSNGDNFIKKLVVHQPMLQLQLLHWVAK